MVTSHSITNKKFKTQMGHIFSHINPRKCTGLGVEVFPSDTMANPKNEACMGNCVMQ